jgi:DNA-binding PadR family transcriptional regulator
MRQNLSNLVENGCIAFSVHEGIEDGDARVFSLTQKAKNTLKILLEAMKSSIDDENIQKQLATT